MLGIGWTLLMNGPMAGLCKSGNEPPGFLKANIHKYDEHISYFFPHHPEIGNVVF